MVQALTGFGIFLCLLSLYSLGTWFGNALVNSSNQVVWDVKTTQEGFLEVSKFLGDPRTTTHPSSSYNQDINVVFQTKGMNQVSKILKGYNFTFFGLNLLAHTWLEARPRFPVIL